MDKFRLVDKLREKAGVSYEEAKDALERCNWDILDAFIFLEKNGRIRKEKTDEYYTNERKEEQDTGYKNDYKDKSDDSRRRRSNLEGVFEVICKAIDICNNIFIKVKKDGRVMLKLPLTLIIVLLIFAFWIIIPLIIVGLFWDIEFEVYSKVVDTDKANKVFRKMSEIASGIKNKLNINKS